MYLSQRKINMESVQPISVVFVKGKVFVPAQNESDSLYNDGYGSRYKQIIKLEPYEVLYLIEKERVTVIDEKNQKLLNFQEILSIYSQHDLLIWIRYVIYRDLRSRGFVIKSEKKLGDCFLVYERGTYGKKVPNYYLYTVYEGASETIEHLKNVLIETEKSGMNLKLAVFDRRSEIVYYSLSKIDFSELSLQENN